MSYSCQFHHLIQLEFDEAYDWYEAGKKGLGERFIEEVRNTMIKLASS